MTRAQAPAVRERTQGRRRHPEKRGERSSVRDERRVAWGRMPALRDRTAAAAHSAVDGAGTPADSERMSGPTGVIRPRVIAAAATLLGFYSALLAYYYVTTFGSRGSDSFGLLLALNLNYWYAWAAVTPGILWLSRRCPLERGALLGSVPAHLAGVFLATLTHVSLVTLGREGIYYATGRNSGRWLEEFQRMFFLNFDFEMATYWAIVGLSHALRYHYEAQNRALTALRLETRLVEAQLQALQRQIQPHFLFNTLNTVSALMHKDVEAADAMLARLGTLLRQAIETVDVQEVALAEELDFLRQYVAIEQARFQDRLTVSFEIEPGAEDCPVPNFVLQPLVENSIRHGIGPRPGPGHVLVRAARAGQILRLEVRDDGVGVDPSRLSDLEHGVGLSNTRSRLAHLYGERHRFAVVHPPGGGLSVQIDIPVEEPAREASEADLLEEGAA